MDVPVGLVPTSSKMQTEKAESRTLLNRVERERTIGLDEGAKGVEEPAMAVELLLVLLLEAKEDLNGT